MSKCELFYSDEFNTLRTFPEGEQVWFVAADVCRALDIKNSRDALSRLEEDEKGVASADTPGGKQQLSTVNEAGLYSLVFVSRKPEAKRFKRWVTHEVLPQIRKNGGYMVERPDETPEETLSRAVLIAQETIKRQELRIRELKPYAHLGECVANEDGLMTVTEATRYLATLNPEIKRDDVFRFLRDKDLMCERGTAPTRRGIDTGRMVQVMSAPILHSDGTTTRRADGKLTAKGLGYLVERLCGGESKCQQA